VTVRPSNCTLSRWKDTPGPTKIEEPTGSTVGVVASDVGVGGGGSSCGTAGGSSTGRDGDAWTIGGGGSTAGVEVLFRRDDPSAFLFVSVVSP